MRDLIVLGAGPAGLTAGIYSARYNVDCMIVGKESGGTANEAHTVENWPGEKSICGEKLMEKFVDHAESLGVEVLEKEVKGIEKTDMGFEVHLEAEEVLESRTVIAALGTEKRKLGLENENRLLGKGISYCATCDAPLYKDATVGVVGGSDSAASSAMLLSKHADKVYILYRRGPLRCEPAMKDRVEGRDNIEVIYDATVEKAVGDGVLEKVVMEQDGDERELELEGLFIEIGTVPSTSLLKGVGVETENSRVVVGEDQSTSVPGLFAAGDITGGSNRFDQIVTASAEGAIAALSTYNYLQDS